LTIEAPVAAKELDNRLARYGCVDGIDRVSGRLID
jgi:hypothetical protein